MVGAVADDYQCQAAILTVMLCLFASILLSGSSRRIFNTVYYTLAGMLWNALAASLGFIASEPDEAQQHQDQGCMFDWTIHWSDSWGNVLQTQMEGRRPVDYTVFNHSGQIIDPFADPPDRIEFPLRFVFKAQQQHQDPNIICNPIFEDDEAWALGDVWCGFECHMPPVPEELTWVPHNPQGCYILVNASDSPDQQNQRDEVWSDSDETSNAAVSASNPGTPIGGWCCFTPPSPPNPNGVATPDHIRSPEDCCTICLQRYKGPHRSCYFCGESPAFHCGGCCYQNGRRTTGPYDRPSCPEATTWSKAPAASSWQGANLVRSLNDRLTRLEAAQIAPPPYKAPPTER